VVTSMVALVAAGKPWPEHPRRCVECAEFCVAATAMGEWLCLNTHCWQARTMYHQFAVQFRADDLPWVPFRTIGILGGTRGIDAEKGVPVWCPRQEAQG
jgi:hypothetical protein